MLENVLGSADFNVLMKRHATELMEMLLKKGINFSLLTNIADVSFSPALPEHISKGFKPITMFFLAGYTFESTQIYNEDFNFDEGHDWNKSQEHYDYVKSDHDMYSRKLKDLKDNPKKYRKEIRDRNIRDYEGKGLLIDAVS